MIQVSTSRFGRALVQDAGCALLAFALNVYLLFPMFGDLTLHVGQSISLLALLLFGFRTGLIAALAAGLGFWWATGGWAMPVMLALETTIIAGLIARGLPMVPAAVVFWLVIGLPLNYLLATVWLNIPHDVLHVSVIKQGINGLLNAALAAGGFQLLVDTLFKRTAHSRRYTSLLRQSFAISVTLVVLPALLMSLVLVNRAVEGFGEEVERRLGQQAQSYAELTERYLDRHVTAVRLIVERSDAMPGAALNADLDRVQRAYPGFLSMVVVDADAEVVYGVPREFFRRFVDAPASARNVADRDWFEEPRRSGLPYLSEGFVGRGFGSDPIVAISAPLIDNTGVFRGVVEGSLSLPHFADLQAPGNDIDFMLIIDNAGNSIYAPDVLGIAPLERVTLQPAQGRRLVDIDQFELAGRRFFAAEASTAQGWTVYVLTRTEALGVPVERFMIIFGITLLVLIALGAWVARVFATGITRPLATLSEQILDRNLKRIELPIDQRKSPEIVQVSVALDQARHLSNRFQKELEKEVAAKTVELRKANRRLGRLAIIDPLTGLLNQRGFMIKADAMLDVVRRESLELTVAMIDIDHFKTINDNYGHLAGDECLRQLAKCMTTAFRRRGDLVARVGGEEFAVLTVADEKHERFACFEQLRSDIETLVVHHDRQEMSLTVSIGAVTSAPSAATELDGLLKAADRALYASKRSGRNRLTEIEPTAGDDESGSTD